MHNFCAGFDDTYLMMDMRSNIHSKKQKHIQTPLHHFMICMKDMWYYGLSHGLSSSVVYSNTHQQMYYMILRVSDLLDTKMAMDLECFLVHMAHGPYGSYLGKNLSKTRYQKVFHWWALIWNSHFWVKNLIEFLMMD